MTTSALKRQLLVCPEVFRYGVRTRRKYSENRAETLTDVADERGVFAAGVAEGTAEVVHLLGGRRDRNGGGWKQSSRTPAAVSFRILLHRVIVSDSGAHVSFTLISVQLQLLFLRNLRNRLRRRSLDMTFSGIRVLFIPGRKPHRHSNNQDKLQTVQTRSTAPCARFISKYAASPWSAWRRFPQTATTCKLVQF